METNNEPVNAEPVNDILVGMQDKMMEIWHDEGMDFEYNGIRYSLVPHDGDEWDDQGKYQYCYPIYFDEISETYWCMAIQRSGSYFTDYDFMVCSDSMNRVVEKEEIITRKVWVSA